mmetsp:Transcript_20785/g.37757  ORF Transcript_20785/g.37757 Transcript_20785/m.37757 type:complete len:212 (+) Transcript_20785:74-709(+)
MPFRVSSVQSQNTKSKTAVHSSFLLLQTNIVPNDKRNNHYKNKNWTKMPSLNPWNNEKKLLWWTLVVPRRQLWIPGTIMIPCRQPNRPTWNEPSFYRDSMYVNKRHLMPLRNVHRPRVPGKLILPFSRNVSEKIFKSSRMKDACAFQRFKLTKEDWWEVSMDVLSLLPCCVFITFKMMPLGLIQACPIRCWNMLWMKKLLDYCHKYERNLV